MSFIEGPCVNCPSNRLPPPPSKSIPLVSAWAPAGLHRERALSFSDEGTIISWCIVIIVTILSGPGWFLQLDSSLTVDPL